MPECEWVNECEFSTGAFAQMTARTVELTKQKYCLNNKRDCARYKVFRTVGKEFVPPIMTPTEIEWARKIVDAPPAERFTI